MQGFCYFSLLLNGLQVSEIITMIENGSLLNEGNKLQ